MAEHWYLAREGFSALLQTLADAGYRCVGPQTRDGAIVYDELTDTAQLPVGLGDEQAPGHYRLRAHDSGRYFAWANGPAALKPLVFHPREKLWEYRREDDGRIGFAAAPTAAERTAVIGVRACDLAALELQDRHFATGPAPDAHYRARRAGLLLVAVNCSHPAATCFCYSTGDGPGAREGYDILLDEFDDGFLVTAGSEAGRDIVQGMALPGADGGLEQRAADQLRAAAEVQQRRLPGTGLRDALFANLDHPRWQEVGERCLSCANCTSVCPTCFCHTHTEVPSLDASESAHFREWDSCFTEGHSYIHGFVIRGETPLRYRQWLTHKLGSWHEQYGRSGCVGCGRCITWCPVGIDITEEAEAICGETVTNG